MPRSQEQERADRLAARARKKRNATGLVNGRAILNKPRPKSLDKVTATNERHAEEQLRKSKAREELLAKQDLEFIQTVRTIENTGGMTIPFEKSWLIERLKRRFANSSVRWRTFTHEVAFYVEKKNNGDDRKADAN